jgi:hypothetical protein
MKDDKKNQLFSLESELLNLVDPVFCKVEVDLVKWLYDLTGVQKWVMDSEDENEHYVSFYMKHNDQQAEITLYNSGFASVDIDGKSVFHGDILDQKHQKGKLNYYRIDNGEKILLN